MIDMDIYEMVGGHIGNINSRLRIIENTLREQEIRLKKLEAQR